MNIESLLAVAFIWAASRVAIVAELVGIPKIKGRGATSPLVERVVQPKVW